MIHFVRNDITDIYNWSVIYVMNRLSNQNVKHLCNHVKANSYSTSMEICVWGVNSWFWWCLNLLCQWQTTDFATDFCLVDEIIKICWKKRHIGNLTCFHLPSWSFSNMLRFIWFFKILHYFTFICITKKGWTSHWTPDPYSPKQTSSALLNLHPDIALPLCWRYIHSRS